MTKISIIVPIYNASAYLKKCIDSLLNQTLKDIEIILINDGSTDDSKDIVKSYKDKRIVFIDKKNEGIGITRNLGISKACGEYISFVDSDDYVDKCFCEKMYRKAVESDCDIVICDHYEDKLGLKPIRFLDFEDTSLKDNPTLINHINLGPCNKIFKRNMFMNKKNRFVENLKYEDAPLVCKLLCEANRIGKLNELLYYYVIHGRSQTTIRDDKIFDIFKITDKIFDILTQYEYLKRPTVNLVVMMLTDYTIQQRYIKSRKTRTQFIDVAFEYLDRLDHQWRKCEYLKRFPFHKRFVKSNKIFTKLYCTIYVLLKR